MSKTARSRSLYTALFGVLLLVGSVIAGVLLVKTEQDVRNKAKELKEHKVTLCHKTSSDNNPWVQIEVSDNALPAHLEHGDIEGNCPSAKKDDNKDQTNNNNNSNQGGVSLGTNVTVFNQTVSADIPTPEIRYIYITTRLDFYIKFQGIDSKKPNKKVRFIFRSPDELHVYNQVWVSADNKGIYHGTLTDIRPGTYDVLIKGDGYLQRKFAQVTITKGANKYHWEKDSMIAGDFNSDNVFDAKDVAELLSMYTEDLVITPDKGIFDVDMNADIDSSDIKIILGNYQHFTLEGDN